MISLPKVGEDLLSIPNYFVKARGPPKIHDNDENKFTVPISQWSYLSEGISYNHTAESDQTRLWTPLISYVDHQRKFDTSKDVDAVCYDCKEFDKLMIRKNLFMCNVCMGDGWRVRDKEL